MRIVGACQANARLRTRVPRRAMNQSERHVVILLAAGGSIRLGSIAKQLLLRHGETLVHRAARLARETFPARMLVVTGGYAEAVTYALDDIRCDLVFNPRWPQGQSSSLACASRALGHHYGPVLLLGCDQPALTLEHLRQLVDLAAANPRGYAATELETGRLITPAVIPGGVLRYVERIRGDHGLAARLNALPPADVARMHAPELEFDIDDAVDLRQAINRGLIDDEEVEYSTGMSPLQALPTFEIRHRA
jgi:molybdenum cofactor cytidylyltransferase